MEEFRNRAEISEEDFPEKCRLAPAAIGALSTTQRQRLAYVWQVQQDNMRLSLWRPPWEFEIPSIISI